MLALVVDTLPEDGVPHAIWLCGDDALNADILVEPDCPGDLVLVVHLELLLEGTVSPIVDFLPVGSLRIRRGVHDTKLAVPDGRVGLLAKVDFTLVRPSDLGLVLVRAVIVSPDGEAEPTQLSEHCGYTWVYWNVHGVVVAREDGIVASEAGFGKVAKVGAERVSIKAEDVIRVLGPDGFGQSVVKGEQAGRTGLIVCGLVQEVVSGHPGVARIVRDCLRGGYSPLVPLGNGLPDPDSPVLELFKLPEEGRWHGIVRVPVKVLATWSGVQVENGVDAVLAVLQGVSDIQTGWNSPARSLGQCT